MASEILPLWIFVNVRLGDLCYTECSANNFIRSVLEGRKDTAQSGDYGCGYSCDVIQVSL